MKVTKQVLLMVSATILVSLLSGCCRFVLYRSELNGLRIGMSRQEVLTQLGKCNSKSAKAMPNGEICEAWVYYVSDYIRFGGSYYLYFIGEQLVQFGESFDWPQPADQIHEVRVR
ncbi:MAG: hypothetical protein WD055_00090 [Candidatus Dependentiae bacterium]